MKQLLDEKARLEADWQEALAFWRTRADGLGMPLDKNILETVAVLNLLSVSTTSSCGGHPDRGILFPYVMLGVHTEEAYEANSREAKLFSWEYAKSSTEDVQSQAEHERRALLRHWRPLHWNNAFQLMPYLDAFYQSHRPVSPEHRLFVRPLLTTGISMLQSFLAAQQQEAIELTCEEKLVCLARDQEEMAAFTAFLKARYFAQAEREIVQRSD
jgi:hypothetical protein